mmetsp:Transcript_44925/g.103842  ORF Transcript_44925/g.103842 Transcript_44925/m.103842 type:complete len:159 (-) Transcript_44925:139-615(-)|eukprot:CAMPEP_0171099598 /NCGR_PEP_ID=MMETSP0766_2-20121228/52018_1 /TAXON_ID=439317 /ORGANISM="Gambierdiscus australes, Strain CAWD 149" /LENGTH=158 /DNA_ID=CAMNT_0011559253 /DNA_START=65 /DNA_END=537 /DNA_ORIENTATION=+
MARPVLLPLALAAALCWHMLPSTAFVPSPRQQPAALVALLAPLPALAELPPLEDLPLDEVNPGTTLMGEPETVFGISFPFVFVGILGAVTWAAFWVSTLKPKKDEEGIYKTYIGGGELPPEGYTNPLDPRLSEKYADDEEIVDIKSKKGERSASSAIV